jgi:hypothetical protein
VPVAQSTQANSLWAGEPSEIAALVAKLSPHRKHESSWFKDVSCRLGIHGWYQLNLNVSFPVRKISLCRHCPRVRLNGVGYGVSIPDGLSFGNRLGCHLLRGLSSNHLLGKDQPARLAAHPREPQVKY